MHSPISIPELGRESVTWAMCRNPMCRNFSVPYRPKETCHPADLTSDANYRIAAKAQRTLACRYCGQRFKTGSNEAIRPVARYFHSLSLPFATCPDPGCENYGVNVYENYVPRGRPWSRPAHYHKGGEHNVRCAKCREKKSVYLGESLGLSKNSEVVKSCERIIEGVLLGVKKRRVIARRNMRVSPSDKNLPKINTGNYYNRLHRSAARLNGYHTWRNALLLNLDCGVNFSEMARVCTDVISIPLKRTGDVHRSRNFKIIVSVLILKDTYYILAAHPFFLPAAFGPDPEADYIDRRSGLPSREFAHQWHCLEHPVHNPISSETPEDMLTSLADVSQFKVGCYIRSPYAEAGHFLVVQKMLQRFPRVCFYMDSAQDQRAAAMVGLADGIVSRRVEVVMVQRKYYTKKEIKKREQGVFDSASKGYGTLLKEGSKERRDALCKAWEETEERVQNVFADRDVKPTKKDPNPSAARKAADAYKTAFLSATKRSGKWAWLDYPPPIGDEKLSRSLWVTRMPGKTFSDAEEPLFHASLQRVESAMNAMRERLLSMRRAGVRAKPARSYRGSYSRARSVVSELLIYLIARNFAVLSRDQKLIPGRVLGLMHEKRPFPYHIHTVFNFRLGLEHAEKLTRWLRQ